jgi:hypothetical protein
VSSISFPATYAIRYYEGDLYQFVIRPKDSAGDPFPISAATHDAYFFASTARGGSASATVELSATIVDGNVVATIEPSDNLGVSATSYIYDVSVKNKTNNQEIYTLLTGTISITRDVTEPTP